MMGVTYSPWVVFILNFCSVDMFTAFIPLHICSWLAPYAMAVQTESCYVCTVAHQSATKEVKSFVIITIFSHNLYRYSVIYLEGRRVECFSSVIEHGTPLFQMVYFHRQTMEDLWVIIIIIATDHQHAHARVGGATPQGVRSITRMKNKAVAILTLGTGVGVSMLLFMQGCTLI